MVLFKDGADGVTAGCLGAVGSGIGVRLFKSWPKGRIAGGSAMATCRIEGKWGPLGLFPKGKGVTEGT